MNTYNEFNEGNNAAKKMLFFLIPAILPLLLIFFIYANNPESQFLHSVLFYTKSLPAIISSNSPTLSKVMDAYVKTAPFMAFVIFLRTHSGLKMKNSNTASHTLLIYLLFSILYAVIIYVFLFTDTELTESVKLLKLMSTNELYLTFFYISLYSGIYVFSYLYLWFCIGTYKLYRERW
jgi:uncharacterized integral membrane protein